MELTVRRSRLARHLHKHEHSELNLSSMIDMMMILVFFLLVHGGFIRLSVLQLNLPSAQSAAQPEPPAFELEITVREASIDIGDRSTGLINRVVKTESGYDYVQLTDELRRIKGSDFEVVTPPPGYVAP